MKRVLFSATLTFLIFSTPALCQRDTLRRVFLNAESWMLYEEYEEALPLYQSLLDADPGNDNLKYKVGICLLNDPYQKDKAIPFLREASQNINPDYKENSYKERTAPPDVLYYLGDAYLVNELIDRAIASYEDFLEIMDRAIYDEQLVQDQIESCRNAQELKKNPVDLDLFLLDSMINSRYSEIQPVVSGDGQKMAFVMELPFYDGAFITQRQGDSWTYPLPITSTLGFDEDIFPVALSYDGSEMILYYDDDYIGNLYYSRLENEEWLPAEKMGENISTKYWESSACFSPDGKHIYFTSNRKGGFGGLDIYRAERREGGRWSTPENLGPVVNSPYNEETPVITEDGTLYFSSYGHHNIGGYDIFYSRQNEDGSWSEPANMGYPINTTDDDMYFAPISNGTGAYYSVYSNKGRGRHDIYYMDIYSEANPRMFTVTGNLLARDGQGNPAEAWIHVLEAVNGDTILRQRPDRESGEFFFRVKEGEYALHMEAEGFEPLVVPLQVGSIEDREGVSLGGAIALTPIAAEKELMVFDGEESMIKVRDTEFEATYGEQIEIPLRVEKGSELVIKTFRDGALISTDTLITDKRRFDLPLEVMPGPHMVQIETRDEEGNLHRRHLLINGTEPVEELADTGRDQDEEGTRVKPEDEIRESGDAQAQQDAAASDEDTLDEADTEETGAESTEPAEETTGRESLPAIQTLSTHPGQELTTKLMLMDLQDEARGELKKTLDNLDLEQEGIRSTRELFEHLYRHAGEKGYSTKEVTALLASVLSGGDLDAFMEALIRHSDGALKEYLMDLDPAALGIDSPEALLLHLQVAGDQHGFSMEEVWDVMINALYKPELPASAVPAGLLLVDLRQQADGPLLDALKQMDPASGDPASQRALFERLYEMADAMGYSIADVDMLLAAQLPGFDGSEGREAMLRELDRQEIRTLAELAGSGDPLLLYQKLLEQSEGALLAFLKDLDPDEIDSIAALMALLEAEAEAGTFPMQDVRNALIGAMEEPLAVEGILAELLEQADGPLADALALIDLRRDGIYSPEALIARLYELLLESGMDKDEARRLLSGHLPDYSSFIDTLGRRGAATRIILGLAGAGLILLFILFWRRRKKD